MKTAKANKSVNLEDGFVMVHGKGEDQQIEVNSQHMKMSPDAAGQARLHMSLQRFAHEPRSGKETHSPSLPKRPYGPRGRKAQCRRVEEGIGWTESFSHGATTDRSDCLLLDPNERSANHHLR